MPYMDKELNFDIRTIDSALLGSRCIVNARIKDGYLPYLEDWHVDLLKKLYSFAVSNKNKTGTLVYLFNEPRYMLELDEFENELAQEFSRIEIKIMELGEGNSKRVRNGVLVCMSCVDLKSLCDDEYKHFADVYSVPIYANYIDTDGFVEAYNAAYDGDGRE